MSPKQVNPSCRGRSEAVLVFLDAFLEYLQCLGVWLSLSQLSFFSISSSAGSLNWECTLELPGNTGSLHSQSNVWILGQCHGFLLCSAVEHGDVYYFGQSNRLEGQTFI